MPYLPIFEFVPASASKFRQSCKARSFFLRVAQHKVSQPGSGSALVEKERKGEGRREEGRKGGRKNIHLRKVLLHPHEPLRIGEASRRCEFIQLNCLSKPQLQHDTLYDTLTVPFRSIRQSRVTGPSVLSKIGPCHRSRSPVSDRSNV
jgi:hypothetical protein